MEEAITLDPKHYNSRYNLGVVLADLGDPKGAREQLEKGSAWPRSYPSPRFASSWPPFCGRSERLS